MSVAIQKVDGVESVQVSLKEGRAKVQLKPGNTVRLSTLREQIEKNGFTPKEASVVAEGELTTVKGRLRFTVSGTAEAFLADASNQRATEGTPTIVEGVVAVAQKGTPERMHISKMQPVGRKTP